MSVLEHHVLIIEEIFWDCLGVFGHFFVGVLVFVILTFFKEGIGSILTMPSWVLVLENGSWVLGLGTWDLGLDS